MAYPRMRSHQEGASALVSLVAIGFLSRAGTFAIDDEIISDTARAHVVQIEGMRAARGLKIFAS